MSVYLEASWVCSQGTACLLLSRRQQKPWACGSHPCQPLPPLHSSVCRCFSGPFSYPANPAQLCCSRALPLLLCSVPPRPVQGQLRPRSQAQGAPLLPHPRVLQLTSTHSMGKQSPLGDQTQLPEAVENSEFCYPILQKIHHKGSMPAKGLCSSRLSVQGLGSQQSGGTGDLWLLQ